MTINETAQHLLLPGGRIIRPRQGHVLRLVVTEEPLPPEPLDHSPKRPGAPRKPGP